MGGSEVPVIFSAVLPTLCRKPPSEVVQTPRDGDAQYSLYRSGDLPSASAECLGPFLQGFQRVRYPPPPPPQELGGADDLFFLNSNMISFVIATFIHWAGAPREELVLFLGTAVIVAILKQAGATGRRSEALKTSPASRSNTFLKRLSRDVVCFPEMSIPRGSPGISWAQAEQLLIWAWNTFFSPRCCFVPQTSQKISSVR